MEELVHELNNLFGKIIGCAEAAEVAVERVQAGAELARIIDLTEAAAAALRRFVGAPDAGRC